MYKTSNNLLQNTVHTNIITNKQKKGVYMKKIIIISIATSLSACAPQVFPDQYVSNMYANGTLNGYENTGTGCSNCEKSCVNCPGCHVKHFDRVKLVVDEVLVESEQRMGNKVVDACLVSVVDSLKLLNISAERYIPAENNLSCAEVYEKEKSYLKAMGFVE